MTLADILKVTTPETKVTVYDRQKLEHTFTGIADDAWQGGVSEKDLQRVVPEIRYSQIYNGICFEIE